MHHHYFQDVGLGDVKSSSYHVAKHGLVAMTRSFSSCQPKVSDIEGHCF